MLTLRLSSLTLVAALLLPAALGAQGNAKPPQVPAGYMPPAGMCRVWVDGVPPNKQPAVTDCQRALRNLPANAQVVFGGGKPAVSEATRSSSSPPAAMRQQILPPTQGRPPARDTTKAKRDTVPPRRPPPPGE